MLDPAPARRFLTGIGYALGQPIYDPLQRVHLQLAEHTDHPRVEIIWADDKPSPLERWLRDHSESLYHSCFEVSDLRGTAALFRSLGKVVPIGKPQPAVLFGGRRVWFLYVRGYGLVELLESD